MSFERSLFLATQRRLAELGYYRGLIDGQDGPLTKTAVTQFKAEHGITSASVAQLLEALFDDAARPKPPPKPKPDEPPWLAEARSLYGVREVPGTGNNPIIMGWARELDQWYPGDDVPWCGLFVGHCMDVGAPQEPQDFNRLGALAWKDYGVKTPPWYGSICRFRRGAPSSGLGHVGFAVGQDVTSWHILGGNQDNEVSTTRVGKDRYVGSCGPTGWTGLPVIGPATIGKLSINEA